MKQTRSFSQFSSGVVVHRASRGTLYRSHGPRSGPRRVTAVVLGFMGLTWACSAAPAQEGPRPTHAQLAPGDSFTDPTADHGATPDGFVEMAVYLVLPTEMGNVVLLTDQYESVMVPIWIGETEALAIALRLEGRGFQRPLTHDLVDGLMRELNAELVEVRIDSLQASTFVASLHIRQGERSILLDARASDSIALALGSHVPIWVSQRVVQEAGMAPGELGIPQNADPRIQAPAHPPTVEQIPL